MKYVIYHYDSFKYQTVMFFFVWIQTNFILMVEVISIILLFSSNTVQGVLANLISLTVLIHINKHYYDQVIAADKQNNLTDVFNHPLPVTHKKNGDTRKGEKWPLSVKAMNCFYIFYKWIYVCFIFYFAPMIYLLINYANVVSMIIAASLSGTVVADAATKWVEILFNY